MSDDHRQLPPETTSQNERAKPSDIVTDPMGAFDRPPLDPVRGPFPAWLLAGVAVLGLGLAGTSGGLVTAGGIFLYAAAGLILGLLTPVRQRATVVRWAGIGMVLQALVRARSEWVLGGVGGVDLASLIPQAAVSLCGFLSAVVLGAWWAGIWTREPAPGDAPDRMARWRSRDPVRPE